MAEAARPGEERGWGEVRSRGGDVEGILGQEIRDGAWGVQVLEWGWGGGRGWASGWECKGYGESLRQQRRLIF